MQKLTVEDLYNRLFEHYGPRNWWPAETPFEVIVGAILTQNTAWSNVEKAIVNLKELNLLAPDSISSVRLHTLEKAVHPSGFFRQKAKRLKEISSHLVVNYEGDLDKFFDRPTSEIRAELLGLNGVGPETADSILLYVGGKPVFVIDAYTKRLVSRLGITDEKDYHELQKFFEDRLPDEVQMFNEYHALIVEICKNTCKGDPLCDNCLLNNNCRYVKTKTKK